MLFFRIFSNFINILKRLHFIYNALEGGIDMKKILSILIIFVLIAAVAACAPKEPSDNSNTLVVYSPNSEGIMNAVIPLFEQKTGIKVEVISAGTGELLARLESEKNAPIADVMFGGTNTLHQSNKHLFMDYVSPENANVFAAYRSQDAFTSNYVIDGRVLIVNVDLAKDIKIEGYADLLNPVLKGRIASGDPAASSSAFSQLVNMLLANGGLENESAWTYVRSIIKQLDGKINSSSSGVYRSVVDGEMVVGLTYEDPILKLLMDGATNIRIVYPVEGAHFTPSSISIINGAKNAENAKKFVDFVLGEDVQEIFGTQLTNRPVRQGVKTGSHLIPLEQINLVHGDMNFVNANRSKLIDRWNSIFAEESK
jgi:iron(III) transport system substrate-binding protein